MGGYCELDQATDENIILPAQVEVNKKQQPEKVIEVTKQRNTVC